MNIRCHQNVTAHLITSFTQVVHITSHHSLDNDFEDPSVAETKAVLKAARDFALTMERVVFNASPAAILNPLNHSKVSEKTVWGEIKGKSNHNNHPCTAQANSSIHNL